VRGDASEVPVDVSLSHLTIGTETFVISAIRDATERRRIDELKRAEAVPRETRESEERYRRMVETTNEGVWLLDSELHTSYVNRQMEEMLGYEPREMVGRSVFDFYFPEDFEHMTQVLKRRQQGVRDQIEERLRRRDGAELWVRMAVSPMFKDSGEFDGALAMVSDITERKRTEEAMRESEERLRLAAQAGKMYAFEWDVATDVVVRSSEYVNVLGRSEPRTLTHQQAMEKVHPDDREKLVAAVDRHSLENPTVDVTYRVLLPGKSPIWVKSSGRAFFDGEGRMLRVIGMVADVTDQKLAEEALRSSEERLRLAQKAARIGTFERNIRTGVNTWTPEMESMYGLPPGGFGQTRTAFENLVHPDDRAEVMKLVDEALKTGQPTHGEWRVVWPDESVHWIAGRWQVLMEESGEPSRVVGVDMDITERKLAEAALANVSRKLIEAQEHERTRIGRELHDDIGQRLAMLAIGLEQLQQESPALPAEVRSQMGELKKQTFEIAADIQSLSHELHSAKLQYLGIAAAMRGFCQVFGEQQRVRLTSKPTICQAPGRQILRFASSEFCKKPCTIR
jgi:PAS domain S-box-containing protein